MESFSDEKRELSDSIARLNNERRTLQNRIDRMYIDKLDGLVEQDFYDKQRFEWRRRQERCLKDIERIQNADDAYMNEGINILNLAKNAYSLFQDQPPQAQSMMLNLLYSNCSWKHGKLSTKFRQPFDLLAETVANDMQNKKAGIRDSDHFENWLPIVDRNRTFCQAPSAEIIQFFASVKDFLVMCRLSVAHHNREVVELFGAVEKMEEW